MKWAIICDAPCEILSPETNQETLEREMIEVPANSIINIIEWDGESAFALPAGQRLEQVADNAKIGDALS